MEKLTPDQFKLLLAKLYAIYSVDYDNSDDGPRYERIEIDGYIYKIGYIINEDDGSVSIRVTARGNN